MRGKGWNGRVRTYYKAVNVAFTRFASARLVAPASPIRLLERLEGSPEHTTNAHTWTREVSRVDCGTESGGVAQKQQRVATGGFALTPNAST
jgi:hypothetical protein